MQDYELVIDTIQYRRGDPVPDVSIATEEVRRVFGIYESNSLLSIRQQVAAMKGDEATLYYYRARAVEVDENKDQQMQSMLADMIEQRTIYKQKAERLRAELWESVVALIELKTDEELSESARSRIDNTIRSMQAVLGTTDV